MLREHAPTGQTPQVLGEARGTVNQPLRLTSPSERTIFLLNDGAPQERNIVDIQCHSYEDDDLSRVTEDGTQRVTEEGQFRVLEPRGNSDSISQAVADAVALLRQQGRKAEARVTADEITVTAFDGTRVRVKTEAIGSPAE